MSLGQSQRLRSRPRAAGVPYSSESGVIFFSSISSSAYSLWYFSQFWPVALGMVDAGRGVARRAEYQRGSVGSEAAMGAAAAAGGMRVWAKMRAAEAVDG